MILDARSDDDPTASEMLAGPGARAQRLTPQEWRVIALALEGVASRDAAVRLGITPGTLDSHRQAVRRKLAIPLGVKFDQFVRQAFEDGQRDERATLETASRRSVQNRQAASERRLRWLLRFTLDELSAVARRAQTRSERLNAMPSAGSNDDASLEVADLDQVAVAVTQLHASLLRQIRDRHATDVQAAMVPGSES